MTIVIDAKSFFAETSFAARKYWINFWSSMQNALSGYEFRYFTDDMEEVEGKGGMAFTPVPKKSLLNFSSPEKHYTEQVMKLIPAAPVCWITASADHLLAGVMQQQLWVTEKLPAHALLPEQHLPGSDLQVVVPDAATLEKGRHTWAREAFSHIISPVSMPGFEPKSWADRQSAKTMFSAGFDYFLYAGPIGPSERMVKLLRAFSLFKKWQHSSMCLLLMGSGTASTKKFLGELNSYKYRDDVKVITDPGDSTTRQVMGAAYACLLFPGNTGYYYPFLDAFASGVPVITNEYPYLQELGSSILMFADPEEPLILGNQLISIFKDEPGRNKLAENGRRFAAGHQVEDAVKLFSALLEP